MLWQKAALPVSRYIVLKSTTRSMPQSQAGYNNAILAAWGAVIYVSKGLATWRSSNLCHGPKSSNLWSSVFRERLGTPKIYFVFLQTLGSVRVTLVCDR